MASIPRGIRVINWKNADKSMSVRYRIRVERKGFTVDRSFDDLERARIFLEDTKTPDGRLRIAQGRDKATIVVSEMERLAEEYITEGRATLGDAIDSYLRDYVTPNLKSPVDKVLRSAKVNRDRLQYCKTIKVGRVKAGFSIPSGALASLRSKAKGYELTPIGEIFLDELTEQETTEYIRVRLAVGLAKSTVRREIGALQSVVNKLRYTDNKAWKKLNGENPFQKCDKALLKGGDRRRRRVISVDEEEALLKELKACRNKEMPLIFSLALSTGMRRAEVLGLEWQQVDLKRGVIYLEPDQTKSREDRMVILLPEAIKALKAVPKKDERLFHYTIEGFKTVFSRVVKRAGLVDVKLHDTRRSFISRVLNEITASPVSIADMIGAKSIGNLQRTTLNPLKQASIIEAKIIRTEEDLRLIVGHKNSQTTARYANTAPSKSQSPVVAKKAKKKVQSNE
jgi:integrase